MGHQAGNNNGGGGFNIWKTISYNYKYSVTSVSSKIMNLKKTVDNE